MNITEQREYLKEFKKYAKEINSSKESAQNFLIRAGINTKTGRLTKHYKQQKIKQVAKTN